MPDDIAKPLARCIYEAHARSRGIKSTWQGIGGTERQHWLNVAEAALSFLGEFQDAIEDEELRPDTGVFGG